MRAWFSVALVLELAGFEAAAQDAPKLFEQRCALCHGGDGSGSDRGPALARSRQAPRSFEG
jgi:mono/diheme cytochrome c family protein